MILCHLVILVSILIELINLNVNASIWATPEQEKLDELHDAEILKSVQDSIARWNQRHRNHSRHKRAETNVCYGDLGCFDSTGPFSYLDMTPSPPSDIRTRFLMYPGKRAGRSTNLLDVPFENMTTAWEWADHGGFNKSLPTKIIVHGFGSSCTSVWVYEMRSALMAVEECNIICVDWEAGAVIPNYVRAAANTRLVGAQLARLLRGLNEHAGLSTQDMHLIGFSLGAHVAGFAGNELGGNISRITGLDPAGPLFESQDPRVRLDSGDAQFVDVIHSNGENIILGGLGSWQPMGDVDFYPNGGRMQKGCSHLFVGAVSDIIWSSAVEGRSLCNHRRAYKFFTDSVSPRCQFPAFPCDSYESFIAGKCFPCSSERQCGNMGYYANQAMGRGQLYLITRDEEPFCAHQYNVKIESSPSETSVVSYGKILITLVGKSDLNETFTMTQKDDAELVLGGSLSKILVPHPILGEPERVQILYIAYSGWLSSGLARWRIDKVSFSDSFGKILSICQKGLDLESGVPVVLPLFAGDCDILNNSSKVKNSTSSEIIINNTNDTEIKSNHTPKTDDDSKNMSQFISTPVVLIDNDKLSPLHHYIPNSEDRRDDFIESESMNKHQVTLTLPWKPIEKEFTESNSLDDDEKESSRALNTRAVKLVDKNDSSFSEIIHKEVVEPVLKPNQPHFNKIARSHDINKDKIVKSEISEPILSSSTLRNRKLHNKLQQNDWIPTVTTEQEIRKPFIGKLIGKDLHNYRNSRNQNEVNSDEEDDQNKNRNIVSITVQLLPQKLAHMLEQAERYARMTLLPLISAHTPKIITDFVNTFGNNHTPKYLPISFEEIDITTKNSLDYNQTEMQHTNYIIDNEINGTINNDLTTFETAFETPVTAATAPNESLYIVYPIQNKTLKLYSLQTNNIDTKSSDSLTNFTTTLNLTNSIHDNNVDRNLDKHSVTTVNEQTTTTTTNNIINKLLTVPKQKTMNNLNIGEILLPPDQIPSESKSFETSTLSASQHQTQASSNRQNKLYVHLPIYNETRANFSQLEILSTTTPPTIKYIPVSLDLVTNKTEIL